MRRTPFGLAPHALSVLVCFGIAFSVTAQPAPDTARYRVTFEATWAAATHAWHPGAHFSPPVGGTHDGRLEVWRPGGQASFEIKEMAQKGRPGPMRALVEAAIAVGTAGEVVEGEGIRSPGSVAMEFTATAEHPLLTLVTMVAPSPDWFVGVAGLPLRPDGRWVERRVVDLYAWDAGTDSGEDFDSANLRTQPQEPIALLGEPLRPIGNEPPVGRLVVERLDAPPAPVLSLGEGAFEVTARWRVVDDAGSSSGSGQGTAITADTGTFWFFDPTNVELIVKVVDACAVNGHRWVFAAGLTAVEVELAVTETATGLRRTTRNPANTPFRPVQETRAFPCS